MWAVRKIRKIFVRNQAEQAFELMDHSHNDIVQTAWRDKFEEIFPLERRVENSKNESKRAALEDTEKTGCNSKAAKKIAGDAIFLVEDTNEKHGA